MRLRLLALLRPPGARWNRPRNWCETLQPGCNRAAA
jgi:hypothetical protein